MCNTPVCLCVYEYVLEMKMFQTANLIRRIEILKEGTGNEGEREPCNNNKSIFLVDQLAILFRFEP